MAIILRAAPPGTTGGSYQGLGERIAGSDDEPGTVTVCFHDHAIDRVLSVGRDIGDASVLVQNEVISEPSTGNKLRQPGWLERHGINRNAHHKLL